MIATGLAAELEKRAMAQMVREPAETIIARPSLSVVMPAYNEAASLRPIVERLRSELPAAELIVVDDGSRDQTAMVVADLPVRVVRHPYNKGNGAAVRTGIRTATGEWILLLDADGQHQAEDVGRLLRFTDSYDLIVGARSSESQASPIRAAGNWLLNQLASYVVGHPVADLTSGFRLMRRSVVNEFLHLFPNRYSYPTTSTLCFFKAGYSVKFVPLTAERRRSGRSGIKLMRDGAKFLMIIFRIMTLFSPLKLFLPICLLVLTSGLASAMYETLLFGRLRIPNSAVLLLLASLLIFLMGLISEQITALRFERREP
jgi:glycosyltransferase involved in cell wall biosynthesis